MFWLKTFALVNLMIFATGSAVLAGELSGLEVDESMNYSTSKCVSPSVPDFSATTVDEYEQKTLLYEAWVSDLNANILCLQNEVRADLSQVQQQMMQYANGRALQSQEQVGLAKAELDAAFAELSANQQE